MRVLFYGSRGWLGNMIVKKWSELHPEDEIICSQTRLNFSNIDKIISDLEGIDRVFITIGRTYGYDKDGTLINNIDYLEDHLDENLNDNLAMPLLVSILCKERDIHLSYMGTGCIFSRDTRNLDYKYTEEDVPDYTGSGYSAVKGVTDNLIKRFNNVLNLRIRMPVTDDLHCRNFISKILSYKKICSYPNSMTYLPDLIPLMIDMSRNKVTGTYNMTNTGHVTHSDILQKYNEYRHHEYELIDESALNSMLKSKRSNNVLDNSKLTELFPGRIRHIQECISEAVEKIVKLK